MCVEEGMEEEGVVWHGPDCHCQLFGMVKDVMHVPLTTGQILCMCETGRSFSPS